jgi:glutamate racemase
MGENVTLVNPAYETAIELKQLLQEKQLDRQESTPAVYQFYVSDLAAQFQEFANSILPYDVANTEKIDIEAY